MFGFLGSNAGVLESLFYSVVSRLGGLILRVGFGGVSLLLCLGGGAGEGRDLLFVGSPVWGGAGHHILVLNQG